MYLCVYEYFLPSHVQCVYIPRMENWNERARRRLTDLGLTQEDLCQPLKVKTRSAVGHYLTGRRQVTPLQLVALAHTLHCSLDWLMTGVGAYRVNDDEPTPGQAQTPDEQILLERYRQIGTPAQAAVQLMIEALTLLARVRQSKK